MTEEEAISRLVACKEVVELIEANLQHEGTLPLEGASKDQLDQLEHLLEVDPAIFSKARPRKKAGLSAEQVGLLYDQRAFIEQQKILKNLMGNKRVEDTGV